MELMDRPLGDEKSASFGFEIEKQSGNEVLNINSLSIGYENETVSNDISFNSKEVTVLLLLDQMESENQPC